MKTRQLRFWLGLVSVFVCLLLGPAAAEAQCGVTMGCTVVGQTTYFFPNPTTYTYIRITKTLNMAANCPDPTGANANAFACGESPSNAAATKLIAAAETGTATPLCNWACNCGVGCNPQAISISGADGLPVELMDFGIEEGFGVGEPESDGSAEESGDGNAAEH